MNITCPSCEGPLQERVARSFGLTVCEHRYLIAMRELQRDIDAGISSSCNVGLEIPIFPMSPQGNKYAYCLFCEKCALVVLVKSRMIPSSEIPAIAI